MKIEQVNSETFRITDVKSLDPITVVLQDFGDGKGNLIVACFGEAWSAYWNAMGDRTLHKFVCQCDADYVMNNLMRSNPRMTKSKQVYLLRIVEAVQCALETLPGS